MMMRLAVSRKQHNLGLHHTALFRRERPERDLFNDTFGNIITIARSAAVTNPPLSFEGIQDGSSILMKQVDTDGQPIMFPSNLILVVGPHSPRPRRVHMKMAASVDLSVRGGNQNNRSFPTSRLRSDTNPSWATWTSWWISASRWSTASGVKDTSWLLVMIPIRKPRPACEMGFLQSIGETRNSCSAARTPSGPVARSTDAR